MALRRGAEMPTYEYRCKSCEHQMEAFQSIKDAALTDCPQCREPMTLHQVCKACGYYRSREVVPKAP